MAQDKADIVFNLQLLETGAEAKAEQLLSLRAAIPTPDGPVTVKVSELTEADVSRDAKTLASIADPAIREEAIRQRLLAYLPILALSQEVARHLLAVPELARQQYGQLMQHLQKMEELRERERNKG